MTASCTSTRPEDRELEIDRVERLDLRNRATVMRRDHPIRLAVESQDLERLRDRIDEPYVRDALAREDRQLLSAIDGGRRRREHFAHPVGPDAQKGRGRDLGDAITPPTGQVRHEHVASEVQLRLVEDEPAAGTAATSLERSAEDLSERARRCRVRCSRAREDVEPVTDDLADLMLRQRFDVGVRGSAKRLGRHLEDFITRRVHARP